MLRNKFIQSLLFTAAALILIFVGSCVKQESASKGELALTLPKTSTTYKVGQQFIYVVSELAWTIDLVFGEDDDEWVSVSPSSGSGSNSAVVMSWTENEGESSRSCTLNLTDTDGDTASVSFTQTSRSTSSGGSTVTELVSEAVPGWLELPAIEETEGVYFLTHDMTLSNETVRNYSFWYDINAKCARWVAYPLNKSLIGSGSRTNSWGYDPKVPSNYQPNLSSSYSGSYDRGHQLPSADRLASGANEATFYYTNLAPQEAGLNQNAWATLEKKVRDWSKLLDTLYVVTGVDLNGSTLVAYDKDDNEITVPVGFFKALLGYKQGSSVSNSTGGYIGIAFYYEHRTDYSSKSESVMEQSMSIDELEAKLDMDFFVNLPSKVGDDIAATVESQIHSWWESN